MWQPIETAPKDGSFILLATPKGRIADGFWSPVYGVWSWPYVMVEPTHWMPLLERPNAQAQPAPSIKDAIIDDLQSQFDSEGITEHDSGDALIRLSDAIAAVEDNFVQPAPSVPEGFSREDLEAVADGLDGYEKTVNVGNVTGGGDDHLESTTAYAARFIRAMLAVPETKP